jgi:dephospho-CoA kinase
MLKIGLTGGIGSGKTTVARVFETIGISVFNADNEAKKTYSDPNVRKQITKLFGENIYLNQSEIDKKLLASKIFSDKNLLSKVNEIIHPAVEKRFTAWISQQKSPYIIHEAAILFESGFDKLMDKNILVVAPQEIKLQRITERDKSSRQQILQRIQNQFSDEKLMQYADFIIDNDNKKALIPQILKIHEKILNEINL